MALVKCSICGKEKSARGIQLHEKFCKGGTDSTEGKCKLCNGELRLLIPSKKNELEEIEKGFVEVCLSCRELY